MATHYETLGVPQTATAAEIRSAYRKIVLKHHPDRSKDPRSPAIFMAATAAWDVLSEAGQKLRYDESLDAKVHAEAERVRKASHAGAQAAAQAASAYVDEVRGSGQRPGWSAPRDDPKSVSEDIQKLNHLFSRGQLAEAEKLARAIAGVAPRQPVPYAVLGDIAKTRGNLNEAAKMYAYAAQFEPNNPVYQRRYEELLSRSQVVQDRNFSTKLAAEDRKVLAPMVGGVFVLIAAIYVAVSHEGSFFQRLPLISTWTMGLPVALFLCGIVLGASLSSGNVLAPFQTESTAASGRMAPALAISFVAIINYWVAVLLFFFAGSMNRVFHHSTGFIFLAVGGILSVMAIAAHFSGVISPGQLLLWGGNIAYLGAILGWMVTDSLKAGA